MLTEPLLSGEEEQLLIRTFEYKFKKMTGKPCTVLVSNQVDDVLRTLSVKEILDAVELLNLPEMPPLRSKRRKREIVNLRKIYCLLAKRAGYHLYTIGDEMGERDHTTVIHNIKEGTNHLKTETDFRYLYQKAENKIMEMYEGRLEAHSPDRDQPEQSLSAVLL